MDSWETLPSAPSSPGPREVTSSALEVSIEVAMKRNRIATRGAVFVEAIAVVSFFIIAFLGIVYFRDLYLEKLRVQRMARAAAMMYAMGACASDPNAAIAADLPGR